MQRRFMPGSFFESADFPLEKHVAEVRSESWRMTATRKQNE